MSWTVASSCRGPSMVMVPKGFLGASSLAAAAPGMPGAAGFCGLAGGGAPGGAPGGAAGGADATLLNKLLDIAAHKPALLFQGEGHAEHRLLGLDALEDGSEARVFKRLVGGAAGSTGTRKARRASGRSALCARRRRRAL